MASRQKTAGQSQPAVPRKGRAMLCACLWIAIVLSSLGVVYSTYETRQATQKLEELRRQAAALQVNSGKYLLEKSALAAYNRVESEAQAQLGMEVPSLENTEMVRR